MLCPNWGFRLTVQNPDRVWELDAGTVDEASAWEAVLADLRPRLQSALDERYNGVDTIPP